MKYNLYVEDVSVEAVFNKLGGIKGARSFLRDGVVLTKPKLLRKVATAKVPGFARFVNDETSRKEANISWTGSNFDKFFGDLVEENVAEATIAVWHLEQNSKNSPIRTELGDREVIKLAQFVSMIKEQSQRQKGKLLVNGFANVAYIIGNDGNVWAVSTYWNSACGYWDVGASSVDSPGEWYDGNQILSRDS